MGRSYQNRFCQWEAAERRRVQLEQQDGRPRIVTADAAGYWRVKLWTLDKSIRRVIQSHYRATH